MNLWYELNYTLRVLKKKLGFSTLCVLVIALGYGIAIPFYSIVKNFAYAPLPFPDADRLVVVKQTDSRTGSEFSAFSSDLYLFNVLRDSALSLDVLAAFQETAVTLSGGEYAETFYGARISADALALTATNPILGRSLQPTDQIIGADPVVLLGYAAWQNYYAGSSEVIGTSARIDGVPHTIVGVMPAGYKFPESVEVWLPFSNAAAAEPGEGPPLMLIGRLVTGVSRAEATVELANLMSARSAEFPEHYENRSAKLSPLIHASVRNGFPLFNMIGGLAFGVFVLVCVNVGNLLLLRANERFNELAIRSAIGASRINLISHALLESLLVCLLGTLFGIFLAILGLRFFSSVLLNEFEGGRITPFWIDFGFQADYGLVAIFLMLLLWLGSGGFAAWRASRLDLTAAIGGGSKGATSNSSGKFIRSLVLIQTVLSFGLLVIAGAFLIILPQRYQTDNVELSDEFLKARITLGTEKYRDESNQEIFRRDLNQQLLQQGGRAEEAIYTTALPSELGSYVLMSQAREELAAAPQAARHYMAWVSNNYFEALNLPLLQGRYFDNADTTVSETVVVVDSAFAGGVQAGESPVGTLIQIGRVNGTGSAKTRGELARIVGVVPHMGPETTESGATPSKIYRPFSQGAPGKFNLLLRIEDEQLQSFADIELRLRQVGNSIDGDVPIDQFSILSEAMGQSNPELKLFGGIFGGAALAALLLASVGMYGLISRSVFARTGEIGIRRAIGSSDWSIIKIFLNQGLFFIATGIVVGGGGAVLILGALESSLANFNVFSSISAVLVFVTVTIGALICYASFVPARKVVGMEPGEALHYE